jgi:hypothetical protein
MQAAEVVPSPPLTPRRFTLRHSRRGVTTLLGLLGVFLGLSDLLAAPPVRAQTPSDFFLHGAGGTDNPPALFLDTTAPTDTIRGGGGLEEGVRSCNHTSGGTILGACPVPCGSRFRGQFTT